MKKMVLFVFFTFVATIPGYLYSTEPGDGLSVMAVRLSGTNAGGSQYYDYYDLQKQSMAIKIIPSATYECYIWENENPKLFAVVKQYIDRHLDSLKIYTNGPIITTTTTTTADTSRSATTNYSQLVATSTAETTNKTYTTTVAANPSSTTIVSSNQNIYSNPYDTLILCYQVFQVNYGTSYKVKIIGVGTKNN